MSIIDCSSRIAIVGVGGIFPGAADVQAFWHNIANGIDSGRHVPAGRWFLAPETAYEASGPNADRVYSTWGCFIEGFQFDPSGLNIELDLLERVDPVVHLGLHTARAAFRDANELRGTRLERVGVILGNIALPTESTSAMCRDILGRTLIEKMISALPNSRNHQDQLRARLQDESNSTKWHPSNRLAASLPATMISQGLNLGGSAYTLDAACASSLYALKFACEELLDFRADAMLAGGMSRPDCQYTQMGFAQLKALSRRGRCAPLSGSADGLVVGEGAGVFVLKRLNDALAAGDQIYATIAGIGLSNDRGANLLAPHSEGQLRAMQAAYQQAGWRPSDVDLIECHATGTPVGDSVEIASLHQLWSDEKSVPGQCVIGGVKSNVGHLLTGAGAAGLMKVLMALKHTTLPPTANFDTPAPLLDQNSSPFRVLTQSAPWSCRKGAASDRHTSVTSSAVVPRRATVNAFGFGGINAHLLVEEFLNDAPSDAHQRPIMLPGVSSPVRDVPGTTNLNIAVVGIAAQVGEIRDQSARTISELNDWGVAQSDWYGREFDSRSDHDQTVIAPITTVRLPLGRFRIPPLEMQDMLPQQQLMLNVAADALQDVRDRNSPSNDEHLSNRTGVFIGIELDPNTANFHLRWSVEQEAPRWAGRLGFHLTEAELTDWIRQLKEATWPALTANRVMGNLGGIVASRLAREFNVGGPSFTISAAENSGLRASELAANMLRRGELDLAIVGAVDLPCDIRNRIAEMRENSQGQEQPLRDGAAAVIFKRLEDAIRDHDIIYAVIDRFDAADAMPVASIAKASHRAGAATGIVTLVNAIKSLYEATLDFPTKHCWLTNRRDGMRCIHVAGLNRDGRNLRIDLSEFESTSAVPEQRLDQASAQLLQTNIKGINSILPAALFVIDGDSPGLIAAGLQELASEVVAAAALPPDQSISIHQLAVNWFRRRPLNHFHSFALTLVAKDLNELSDLINSGHRRLSQELSANELDRRVQFTFRPLGRSGRLAFVFPGSGNAFPGMGRELLAAFPDVLRKQGTENQRLRDQYRPDLFWNGNSARELCEDHKAMIFGQVALGTAVCDLLARFQIRPTASIGYSLGESAALFGLRAWTDRDEMLQRMDDAALFGRDLVKPFDAARSFWQIPTNQDVDWITGIIDRSVEIVQQAINRQRQSAETPEGFVYLLIINTPTQCVVGGLRRSVEEFAARLGATFVPFVAPSTVHCEILKQVVPAYRALHVMKTTSVSGTVGDKIDIYSTAWGRSYELTTDSAADAIVAQAVNTIDFPRVIRQAYDDGVRLFVEIGPGSSCTRMIDEILGDQPHFAQAATPVTASPVKAFVELLAALIAHRVPVELQCLYGDCHAANVAEALTAREIVTRTGAPPFEIPLPSVDWNLTPEVIDMDKTPVIGDQPQNSRDATRMAVMTQLRAIMATRLKVHEQYLTVSSKIQQMAAAQVELLTSLSSEIATPVVDQPTRLSHQPHHPISRWTSEDAGCGVNGTHPTILPYLTETPPRSLSRQECLEFAIGQIGRVLGPKFAEIDRHPTRVRLPDEPLMLVDRILEVEGEPLSMTSGRVVTEHDVFPNAWYLDCDRIPTCIAVEAGQADLFLSGWLGIDLQTRGLACYRLLDAVVTFHQGLCRPGQTIHYDIRINSFFRQGQTYLFRFEFDATVDGQPLLTMREGCAGFFTADELASGKGIVHTALDRQTRPGKRPADWCELVTMTTESYDDAQLLALRRGQLEACFGAAFGGLKLNNPVTIPGLANDVARTKQQAGSGVPRSRMWLIDRVLKLDPAGGKYGMGTILGELDIHPDDWFITCHFCDDQVMPGTLMYECCLHTLRVFLLRMGWVGETGTVAYEPIPGVRSRLKCRGQVLASTRKVWYEITLKEIGYASDTANSSSDGNASLDSDAAGAPFCIADALMYADGKPIVEITDMSVRLAGLTRETIESLWSSRTDTNSVASQAVVYDRRPALFDTERITAFAIGKPSQAFGDRYQIFDSQRTIARLPGPPFQFLDRIVAIKGCQPWVMQAGGEIVAQYDVPPDAWYFAANRQRQMPFAVLLETALQPCGWLAAYVGSALTSEIDLSFRNLGGSARQLREVIAQSGTLTTTVKMTRVSNSGGMIIQHYDFDLCCEGQSVYVGNTYFGFFSRASLANQIGIRDAKPFLPSADERAAATNFRYCDQAPFADRHLQMIDDVQLSLTGGPAGHGFVIGSTSVRPDSWFFKAHFFQDPVVPGSLGLESFFQLLKFYAAGRWHLGPETQFETPLIQGAMSNTVKSHEWVYRGQIVPRDARVTVSAVVTHVDDANRELTAEGFLSVDGRVIYQMKQFTLGCR